MFSREMVEDIADKFGGIGISKQPKTNSEVRASETKPINTKLQESFSYPKLVLKPRRYQEEIYRKALEENVIVYLGTGLGKTFIIVMLLKDAKFSEQIDLGKKVVFLAITQDLVKQQAEYIARHVPHKVKVYCGRTCNAGNHIDNWSKADWDSELKKIDIFFMTPAILSAALAINVLNWNSFSMVIFDEAHHAATSKKERLGKSSGHFYSQILSHYKNMFAPTNAPKPRIVALTASLINNVPKDISSIKNNIDDLQKKFDAKCVTDLGVIGSKPQVVIYSYNKPTVNKENDTIIRLFKEYATRMKGVLDIAKLSDTGPRTAEQKMILAYHNRLRLASSNFSIKPKSFYKVLLQLAAIRTNSGAWTLCNILYNLVNAMSSHRKMLAQGSEIAPVYTEFGSILFRIILAIRSAIGPSDQDLIFEYSQPKLMTLLEALRIENRRIQDRPPDEQLKFSCIVFVRSRVEVFAIFNWLKMVSERMPGYQFIKPNYAIGMSATMASKWACITRRRSNEQSSMLQSFRKYELNVIVTTSVLEEGIDLPVCSSVIRYDEAGNFRVHVQSRGRARQPDSTYVALCETEKLEETKLSLNKFHDFEERVKEVLSADPDFAQNLPRTTASGPPEARDEQDCFKDEARGILITAPIARVILHMYCARLSRRCPYADGFSAETHEIAKGTYQTTLLFPPGCPCKDSVSGRPKRYREAAENSAIIAAYRALFEAGELDEHGVPIKATEEHIDKILINHSMSPNFEPLDKELIGEIIATGEIERYSYPWELTRMTSNNLIRNHSSRSYKLFRISFIADADSAVRQDARHYFEKSTFGIIVDGSSNPLFWPDKVYTHYGTYKVEYNLIADGPELDSRQNHQEFVKFTFYLMSNFWGLRDLRLQDFELKCMFYLVPLTRDDNVDWTRLRGAFYSTRQNMKQGDIVKLHYQYRGREGHTRYLVKEIHYELNMKSVVPGLRGVTFTEKFYEKYDESIVDMNQPIIEVCPIAMAQATLKPGKKVSSDYSTQTLFYPWQCLEPIKCDPYIAYQAPSLPEIIYKVYLTELASKLSDKFVRETASDRREIILAPEIIENTDVRVLEDDSSSCASEGSLSLHSGDGHHGHDAESVGSVDTYESYDSDELDSDYDCENSSDTDSDSSDAPAPSNKYRDILSRETINLQEHDRSHLEKWDMSEYNVPDLKTLSFIERTFHHSQRFLDTSPGSTTDQLITDTIDHQERIEDILRQFQKGIMGNAELNDDDELAGRPGATVDLSVKAPLKFDRPGKPLVDRAPQLGFVEALTQKRVGDRFNLEALENIGDSYIKYCISVVLFKYMDHSEGLLTAARSRLVGNKHFAHLAKKNRLGHYAITANYSPEILSSILGSSTYKNTLRAKDLADLFESLVGSCLVYQGEFEAIMALKWLGLGHIFREDTFAELHEKGVAFSRIETALIDDRGGESTAQDYLRKCRGRVRKFESIINYKFSDPSYLVQAFTHATAPERCTGTYERLEFLGDAILDFLVTMTLYDAGFTTDPGQLTFSRSALVNNCNFAKLALKYKYDVFLQHANQELYDEMNRINDFVMANEDLTELDSCEYDRVTKILGDLFESVAAAIYLDSGCSLDTVYSIYYPMMKEAIDKEIATPTKNVIMQLYETFPGQGRIDFLFTKTSSVDDEPPMTTAKCTIFGVGYFCADGLTKAAAKQRAAAEAMKNLPAHEVKQKLDDEYKNMMLAKIKSARPDSGRGRGRGSRGRGGHFSRGQRNSSRGGYSAARQDWQHRPQRNRFDRPYRR